MHPEIAALMMAKPKAQAYMCVALAFAMSHYVRHAVRVLG